LVNNVFVEVMQKELLKPFLILFLYDNTFDNQNMRSKFYHLIVAMARKGDRKKLDF